MYKEKSKRGIILCEFTIIQNMFIKMITLLQIVIDGKVFYED